MTTAFSTACWITTRSVWYMSGFSGISRVHVRVHDHHPLQSTFSRTCSQTLSGHDLTAKQRLFWLSLQTINTCRWLCKEILTLRYPLERPSSADPHQPMPPILSRHGMWPLERRASSCGSSRVRPSRGAMSNCRSRQSTICTRGHDHHSEGDDEPAGEHRAQDGQVSQCEEWLSPLSHSPGEGGG